MSNRYIESLRAAERRLQTAQLNSDVDALTELIDDSALFTGPDGNLFPRTTTCARMQAATKW